MSQIPAAATPQKTTANNKTTKTATESKWIPLCRGRGQSPLSSTVATIILKAAPSGNLCFPPKSAWLEPDPVSSSLVEDNTFLQFDSKSTFSYDLFIFFFFPLSLSLIYNSFDLKFH